MPVDPPPSAWELPDPRGHPDAVGELVGIGADLEPGTVLAAYRKGVFPMPLPTDVEVPDDISHRVGWWSPDPRGVLPIDGLRVSRSLRKSAMRFEATVDSAFDKVIEHCADPTRPHGWIDQTIIDAYSNLFELGWVHSVEVWNHRTGALAGGLYGIQIGAFFAGESMFHTETDASKVALIALMDLLQQRAVQLIDVQWPTAHLESLGVVGISRDEYLMRLERAVSGVSEPLGPLHEPWRFQELTH